MECVFGLAGNGFAIVAADTSAGDGGILLHKKDEDKIMALDFRKLIAASGERGDRVQFTEYIQKHVSLYEFRNGYPLTTHAAANFIRVQLATALRKNPCSVNMLIAGYDKEAGASLYSLDYLGTLHKVDKGAFGYGSYLSLSTMDRHYRSNMSFDEALDLVKDCIVEIKSRLVTAPPNFVIKIVDEDGGRHHCTIDSTNSMVFPNSSQTRIVIPGIDLKSLGLLPMTSRKSLGLLPMTSRRFKTRVEAEEWAALQRFSRRYETPFVAEEKTSKVVETETEDKTAPSVS